MGTGGAGEGQARGQADLRVDRLQHLLLVPRRRAHHLLRPRHRQADERVVRQHQGRPRAAARHRSDLRPGHADPGWARRLAQQRLPHPRFEAVLRRQLLSTGGRCARTARLSDDTQGSPSSLEHAESRGSARGRPDLRGDAGRAETGRVGSASTHLTRGLAGRGARRDPAELRRSPWRRRRRPHEIPPRTGPRAAAGQGTHCAGSQSAGGTDEDARRDGARRNS